MISPDNKKKAIEPDDVEKWAEWLDKQPKRTRLTDNQMKVLLACVTSEHKMENDEEAKRLVAPRQYNLASMFYNRVKECHTYEVTVAVALFISELVDRPGTVVIYANYLQYKAWKHGIKKINMECLSKMIPLGVFSNETLMEAWNKQKRYGMDGSDNMLDYGIAQKSIEIGN